MIFALIQDLADVLGAMPAGHPRRRILKLLDEAIRRDMHFIDRHPTALFQCLWNACWWYDCPEAAEFYEAPLGQDGKPVIGPYGPWQEDADKLSERLAAWRRIKEEALPGFAWLRARRPPQVPLGTALKAELRGHGSDLWSVAWSPSGSLIFSAGGTHGLQRVDATIRIWDAAVGRELHCLRGHDRAVRGLALSNDGRRIVSGSEDLSIRLWDVESGRELVSMRGHTGEITGIAFDSTNGRIASGAMDGTLRIWDALSGDELSLRRDHGRILCLEYSPCGRYLASGSWDHETVLIRDLSGGASTELSGHDGVVFSLAFSPDGRRIATGGSIDKQIRIWDVATGQLLLCCQGHDEQVNGLAFGRDGRRLVSASDDSTIRTWDAETGAHLRCFRCLGPVRSAAFSPDSRWIVSGGIDATVRVWDAEARQSLPRMRDHGSWINSLAFRADGRELLSSGNDHHAHTWDPETGRILGDLYGALSINKAVYRPDGRHIAGGGEHGIVCIWDARTGKELNRFWDLRHSAEDPNHLRGQERSISDLVYSPDGRRIAVSTYDGAVRLWDPETKAIRMVLHPPGYRPGIKLAYSPDGRRLAALAWDGLRIWDAVRGEELKRLPVDNDDVTAVAWTPDGRRLLAEAGGSVRVWDAVSGEHLATLPGLGDLAAMAVPPADSRWRAVRRNHELTIVDENGGDVAWFSGETGELATHPRGGIWAAAEGGHLLLLILEGVERAGPLPSAARPWWRLW